MEHQDFSLVVIHGKKNLLLIDKLNLKAMLIYMLLNLKMIMTILKTQLFQKIFANKLHKHVI